MGSISPGCSDLALPGAEALAARFARQGYVLCACALTSEGTRELRARALELVKQRGRRIEQQSAEHVLRYRVVTGEEVRSEWPELFAIYQSSELREWVAAVAGVPAVFNSSHLRSAINVNAMGEPGEIYRWHHDAAGFTLLLYLSDSREQDGGALQLRPPGAAAAMSWQPVAGTVVLMDGTRCLHRVAPIAQPHERISIPMVFTTDPNDERPAGLDDYLYRP